MRPGLLAIGAVFALVGAGVIVAVLWPGDAPTLPRSSAVAVEGLAPSESRTLTVPATAAASAQLTMHWFASAAVAVNWYLTQTCQSPQGWCIESSPVQSWSGLTSGTWTDSGAAIGLYVVFVQDTANVSVNFSATLTENYHPSPLSLPVLPLSIVLGAGSLLVGTGAVALYLGLFLPSGVFTGGGGSRALFDEPYVEEWDESSSPPGSPPAP